MKHFTNVVGMLCLLLSGASVFAQVCDCEAPGNCDAVIDLNIKSIYTDAELRALVGNPANLGGKKFCLRGGQYAHRAQFTGVTGASGNPVIFKNCDGLVEITGTGTNAILFTDAKYVSLVGNSCSAAPDNIKYGFRARSDIQNIVCFLTSATGKMTDIEVAWLDVGGDSGNQGDAGIKILDQPGCDTDTISNRNDPRRWIIRNLSVHDNYVHNTGDEGFYIGKGDGWYADGGFDPLSSCPTTRTFSNSIKGVRIYNNITNHTGWDGLQLKDADNDVKVYNNYITDFGVDLKDTQNEGLVLGHGSIGDVYNNTIINGSGWGFFYKGLGDLNFYNNLIVNTGAEAIYLNGHETHASQALDFIRLVNNTIVKTGSVGVVLSNYETIVPERVAVNNIVAGVNASSPVFSGNYSEKAYNREDRDANAIQFKTYNSSTPQDFLDNDYHLQQTSPAIDAGKDASVYGFAGFGTDFDGASRNYNNAWDIGRYEFHGDGSSSDLELFINAGGDTYIETLTGGGTKTWEGDRPHATLDGGYAPTFWTGSEAAFGGANNTGIPNQVLGTSRYTSINYPANNTIHYSIPVPSAGDYEVQMYFARKNADTWGANFRKFNIYIENTLITASAPFDVFAMCGSGACKFSASPYVANVTDGALDIKLVAVSGGEAMINAIAVNGPVGGSSMMAFEEPVTMVYPNPASDHIEILPQANKVVRSVKIFNAQQQLVWKDENLISGDAGKTIDISGLNNNQLYIMHLRTEKGVEVIKFFKRSK